MWLDGFNVVFGKVIKGMEVVRQIGQLGSKSGEPTGRVIISDCGLCLDD